MMEASKLVVLCLMAMAGSVVQTTTGFGFGIVAMTAFPFLFSVYAQAITMSTLGSTVISVGISLKNIKYVNFKIIMPIFLGYITTSTFCVSLSTKLDNGFLTRCLGVALILVSLYFIFFNGKITIKPTFLNGIIVGAMGGVGSGLFSIGGPPVVIYLLSAIEDKNEYRANLLGYFAMGNVYITIVRALNGIMDLNFMKLFVAVALSVIVGAYIGNKIFDRINAITLKKFVYGVMIISGLTMAF